jgi:hypothetical protein
MMTRVIAAVVVMLALATGAFAAAGKARVWVSSQQPLVVRGAGFNAQERVTVSVSARDLSTRKVVWATATGTLTARFPTASIDGACGAVFVRALRANGTYVTWKRVTDCAGLQPVDK